MLNKYEQIGKKIGSLVEHKNDCYGDVTRKSGEIFKILYPNGIKTEEYTEMIALVRVMDKISRIANGNKGDENAWKDLAGYGILGVVRTEETHGYKFE